jgi:hypothetical protein
MTLEAPLLTESGQRAQRTTPAEIPTSFAPRPCRIGAFFLAIPAMQAGLAGYSDMAMRVVARRRGCPYAVTEALLDRVLLAGGRGREKGSVLCPEDHPVAGQLLGSHAHEMAAAARILLDCGFDVSDLNFACPVRKVMGRCRGGYLLGDPEQAKTIMRQVRDAVPELDLPELPSGFRPGGVTGYITGMMREAGSKATPAGEPSGEAEPAGEADAAPPAPGAAGPAGVPAGWQSNGASLSGYASGSQLSTFPGGQPEGRLVADLRLELDDPSWN